MTFFQLRTLNLSSGKTHFRLKGRTDPEPELSGIPGAIHLQLLLETYEPPPPPVHLVFYKQSRLPLKLRAFIDFIVPRLRKRLIAAAL